jgi:hypothetical protein
MSDAGFISSFVFWIGVNGLIGYAIGKSKNEISACVLLSVFLGPIGWLIALAVKGNVRKCPFCAEQIKSEAKVCRYCGREVTPTEAPKPAVPSVPKTKSLASDIVIVVVAALVLLGIMLLYAAFKS